MEELIRGLQAGNDGELLIQRCTEAGIVEAIDIAVVDESMHSLILGDSVHLRDLLVLAVLDGGKVVKRWARG